MENPRLKTKQQIAEELGISISTLNRRLREAGIKTGRKLQTIQDQNEIRKCFGFAPVLDKIEIDRVI